MEWRSSLRIVRSQPGHLFHDRCNRLERGDHFVGFDTVVPVGKVQADLWWTEEELDASRALHELAAVINGIELGIRKYLLDSGGKAVPDSLRLSIEVSPTVSSFLEPFHDLPTGLPRAILDEVHVEAHCHESYGSKRSSPSEITAISTHLAPLLALPESGSDAGFDVMKKRTRRFC